jgi:basic membrane lipoprotein Med (substrate-binding protein (PBP1-ABC) superfamily)
MADAIKKSAEAYPDRKFGIIDSDLVEIHLQM